MEIPTVNFHHTIADIINAIAEAGFKIEQMVETKETNAPDNLSKLPRNMAIIAKK